VALIAAERRLLAWLQQRGIMPRLLVRQAATLVRLGGLQCLLGACCNVGAGVL